MRGLDERGAGRYVTALATILWSLGDVTRSRMVGLEAIEILERHAPGPELVHAYGSAAMRDAIGGRFADASELIEKGLALAGQVGAEDVTSLLQARASVKGYQGDAGALEDLRAAIDIGLRLGLGRTTAVAMNNLGDGISYFVGLREARAQWDKGIEFSHGRGLTYAEMWQRGERLRALYHLGEWEELRVEGDRVVRWVREHGGGQLEVLARITMAEVLVHLGALADARANVADVLPRARESGDPQVLVPWLSVAALVAAASNDEPGALAHVVELEEMTRGLSGFRSSCLVWPARIAIAAGELTLAEAFFEGADVESVWGACASLSARAMLAEARGEVGEASALYGDATGRWDAYGSVVEQGYALLGLGRCGDAKRLVEGEAIFARLGASPVLARAA